MTRTPKMTKSHFELIAERTRSFPDFEYTLAGRARLADHFADALAATNPNFDRARFIAAATREG